MAEQELPGGWLPPKAPGAPGERPAPPPVTTRPPEVVGASGLGVTSMICAVCAIGLLVFSLGLSFALSLPLALTGWVCANRTDRPGIGKVLGLVAIALSVVAAIVWLVLMLSGYSPDELQRSLEQELERQRQRS
jgi:hypothetical protein